MAIMRNENVKNCFECRYFNYNSKKKESECMTDIKCDFTKRRTGVLDKNGVEIYEGDYVKVPTGLYYTSLVTDLYICAYIYFDRGFQLKYYLDKEGFLRNYKFDYKNSFLFEIVDSDKIETYTDENGVEKWRMRE